MLESMSRWLTGYDEAKEKYQAIGRNVIDSCLIDYLSAIRNKRESPYEEKTIQEAYKYSDLKYIAEGNVNLLFEHLRITQSMHRRRHHLLFEPLPKHIQPQIITIATIEIPWNPHYNTYSYFSAVVTNPDDTPLYHLNFSHLGYHPLATQQVRKTLHKETTYK